MTRLRLSLYIATLVLIIGALRPSRAIAGAWDLNLGRLCVIETSNGSVIDCGGGYEPSFGLRQPPIPDNGAYRALMSELGAVFAPNILATSETRGFAGFNAAVEFGWTSVNSQNRANVTRDTSNRLTPPDHYYWRAANSVGDVAFAGHDIRNESAINRIQQELPPSFAPTVSAMVRKGLWLPAPSFELGLGMRHLIGSQMVAGVLTAKLALQEGFHGWPIPSVSIRGSASRVVGTPGFNLTVAGLDFAISKLFSMGSTWNLSPYGGYQLLWVITDSEVINATPGVDPMQSQLGSSSSLSLSQCRSLACNGTFTFDDQDLILRHRVFVGARANFYIASLLLEYSYFVAGNATDAFVTGSGAISSIKDEAGAQHAISLAIALDY